MYLFHIRVSVSSGILKVFFISDITSPAWYIQRNKVNILHKCINFNWLYISSLRGIQGPKGKLIEGTCILLKVKFLATEIVVCGLA